MGIAHQAKPSKWREGQISPQRIHFGPVELRVTNLNRALEFWRGQLGLLERPADAEGVAALGTPDETLIVLRPGATQATRPGFAGLYHLAFHLSNESTFAHQVNTLKERNQAFAGADHLLSKSIYLSDPDGIGVEFLLETPEQGKLLGVDENGFPILIDRRGNRRSGRDHLDLEEIVARNPHPRSPMQEEGGLKIGHLHLTVPDLELAQAHYLAQGFELSFYSPGIGMVELHSGGEFSHQFVLNNWQGKDAKPAPASMAGLNLFTLLEANSLLQDTSETSEDPFGNRYQKQWTKP